MQHDIEGAVRGYYPEDLDSAYPGVRDRLLSELSTLRRKAEALDWLEATYFSRSWDGCLDHPALRHTTGWSPRLRGVDLLSAIDRAKEAGRETPA